MFENYYSRYIEFNPWAKYARVKFSERSFWSLPISINFFLKSCNFWWNGSEKWDVFIPINNFLCTGVLSSMAGCHEAPSKCPCASPNVGAIHCIIEGWWAYLLNVLNLNYVPPSNPYTVSLFQIKTPAQLEAAFSFFATTGPEYFKLSEFEEACGVGTVTMGHLAFFVFFFFLFQLQRVIYLDINWAVECSMRTCYIMLYIWPLMQVLTLSLYPFC